jgi:hypothetical protein
VAADDQGWLRRYIWNGKGFDRENLLALTGDVITFNVMTIAN